MRDNEADVLDKFMEYIRTDIFERKEAVTMANLSQQNYVVGDARYNDMKKKVKSLIEKEFKDNFDIYQMENGRLLLIPKNLSAFELAEENFKLKEHIHSSNLGASEKEKTVIKAAKFYGKI